MQLVVTLPLPPRELHPNARVHYMARARAKKAARTKAFDAAVGARLLARSASPYTPTTYHLKWYYWGPCPDEDNCLAACKAYLDGCADAFSINDRTLSCSGITRIHDRTKHLELIFNE